MSETLNPEDLARLQQLLGETRNLYERIFTFAEFPEDCDDCGDLEDKPCRKHGPEFTPVYRAMEAYEDAAGGCQCGHARTRHDPDDSRPCREAGCACRNFKLVDSAPQLLALAAQERPWEPIETMPANELVIAGQFLDGHPETGRPYLSWVHLAIGPAWKKNATHWMPLPAAPLLAPEKE